jgi:hypothetical protein
MQNTQGRIAGPGRINHLAAAETFRTPTEWSVPAPKGTLFFTL